jgi:TolB-like protein
MNGTLKVLSAMAALAVVAPVANAQSGAPVVAVLVFDNGSFGPGAKDYDDVGKGIADVMITDLASSTKVRVVDRTRVQQILAEQQLAKDGKIDAQTAVRAGKMLGACYSIYGTFMRGTNGKNMLTLHTTSNETGQITNPLKVEKDGDDVMSLITEASSKFASAVDVKACAGVSGATRSGDAAPAPTQQSQPAAAAPATKPAASGNDLYAKRISAEQVKRLESVKLDARTMLVYSRALDAKDKKDNAKAKALFQQVVDKYPSFDPAKENLKAVSSGN